MLDSKVGLLQSIKKEAEALLSEQRLPEARAAFSQLCLHSPDDYNAWLNLGAVEGMLGSLAAAKQAFHQALELRNDEPRVFFNLARLCELQEQFDEALHYWCGYLKLRPDDAAGYAQTAQLLHKAGRLPEAAEAMREAVQRNPDEVEYYNNLGVMLGRLGRYDEALKNYQHVLRLRPDVDGVYCNIANLYHNMGNGEMARANFARALALNPDNASTHMNLGFHYARSGCNDEALNSFREALRIAPDNAAAHFNMALLLLLLGRFHEGWQEYEWRFKCNEIKRQDVIARYHSKPQWDGVCLAIEVLLVYVEQGFGDALQFCRYLPLVAQRVKHVIVECHAELLVLLRGQKQFDGIEFVARSIDALLPAVNYDLQIPLMSLPRLFEAEVGPVFKETTYIQSGFQQRERWQRYFNHNKLKVGLVWAGSPDHQRDQMRSLSLSAFNPFSSVSSVCFYSLQKGSAASEVNMPPEGMALINLASDIDDFAETAEVIANLDLVISVDTAVAHLAGAMGKPVWTLIYSPPDWRWLLECTDSPWYPTMRLFRQETGGDWMAVIEHIAIELQKMAFKHDALLNAKTLGVTSG